MRSPPKCGPRAPSAAPGKRRRIRVRIVLDTNVVISALLWRGTPYRLLEAIGQRDELADVLGRPSAAKRLALIGKTARDVLADYVAAVELVEPLEVPRVVAADADDDQVLAAAVTARADLIVSGDRKHLLPLGRHQGIAIVEAGQALQQLDAGASHTPSARP